jgi:hypothetical protein
MNQDFGIIERLFELSPPMLMMVCISLLLRVLKMSKIVQREDWILGLVAMTIGGVVYPQIAEIGKLSYNVRYPLMILVMFGVAMGGLTVALHDTIWRFIFWRFISARFGIPSGSTEITVKTKDETPDGGTIVKTTSTLIKPPDDLPKP